MSNTGFKTELRFYICLGSVESKGCLYMMFFSDQRMGRNYAVNLALCLGQS